MLLRPWARSSAVGLTNSCWRTPKLTVVFGLAVLGKFKLYYAIPSYSRSSSSLISLLMKYFLTLRPLLLSYGELYTLSATLAEFFNLSASSLPPTLGEQNMHGHFFHKLNST